MAGPKVSFVDLRVQYATLKDQIRAEIDSVLERCDFILGQQVADFEAEFAHYIGVPYAVGVANGTEALHLALRACNIGLGDEVLLPANTFIATALAVTYVGATPRLVDVDERTYNIDVTKIEAAITGRTKAIIPVHLYGQPADMDEIMRLAKKYSLTVIEDVCQAHGARYKGRRAGSLGDAAAFSFYPGKNLGAYGDGGAIVTIRPEVYEKTKVLRNLGQPKKYHHNIKGYNSRLDTMQAAILQVKLRHLDAWNASRRRLASLYNQMLSSVPVITPVESGDSQHIYHLYVIRTNRRGALRAYLHENEIETGIHYPIPLHLQPCYTDLEYQRGSFPVTERLADEVLSLPMYPELPDRDVGFVCEKIKEFFR